MLQEVRLFHFLTPARFLLSEIASAGYATAGPTVSRVPVRAVRLLHFRDTLCKLRTPTAGGGHLLSYEARSGAKSRSPKKSQTEGGPGAAGSAHRVSRLATRLSPLARTC